MASRCPFCVKAKAALKSMNADFLAVELDQMPEGSALRAELAKVGTCIIGGWPLQRHFRTCICEAEHAGAEA